MTSEQSPLHRGRIIWAIVSDHRGHLKRRPAIILTPTSQIKEDEPLLVMAITTTFPKPTPKDHVELPWHNDGHPITKLNSRSAAVIAWVDQVLPGGVDGFGGDVPKRKMKEIEDKLNELGE